MAPTLAAGDRVLVIRHWPRQWLRKGQIVVVQNEPAISANLLNPTATLQIKRLIGLPHDTVRIPSQALPPLAVGQPLPSYSRQEGEDWVWSIPVGHGFIKGDGAISIDSVQCGPIPLTTIVGILVTKLSRSQHAAAPAWQWAGASASSSGSGAPLDFTPFPQRTPWVGFEEHPLDDRPPLPGHAGAPKFPAPTDRQPFLMPLPGPSLAPPSHSAGAMPTEMAGATPYSAAPSLAEVGFSGQKRQGVMESLRAISQIIVMAWQAYPPACIASILFTLIQGLLPLASAWVTKVIFDWLALRLTDSTTIGTSLLFWLLAAQALLTVTTAILPALNQYLNAELTRRLTLYIQQSIYEKINSFAGIAYFENPRIYDTIRLAQQGAEFSSNRTLDIVLQLFQHLITVASFIGVLLAFNLTLAGLVALAALPMLVAQLKLGQQRFRLAFDLSANERRKAYYSFLLASVDAAKELRLFGLGSYFLSKLLTLYRHVHQEQRVQEQREVRWELALSILSSVIATAAFVYIVLTAFAQQFTLGDVTLYVSAVAAVQSALIGMVMATAGLNENALFHSYYQALQALPPPIPVKATPEPTPPLQQGLELRQVSFRYHEDQPWILREVNLKIPAGSCLALVGLNGAGKTTLVKLLTRLYDPTEGVILWDGIDIREFAPEVLRQRIGAIFQDFMRYDLTVQENIGVGNIADLNQMSAIQQAAKQANLHEDILRLPHGYQTELSRMFAEEGYGLDLSGGQWQKVATARMLIRPADLLILDEPTAALDAQSEHDLYQHFAELMAGRTSLLISHRFSTVRMADAIAVLADGRIAEYGTHAQLMQANGSYAHLYNLQAASYLSPEAVTAAL